MIFFFAFEMSSEQGDHRPRLQGKPKDRSSRPYILVRSAAPFSVLRRMRLINEQQFGNEYLLGINYRACQGVQLKAALT